MNWIKRNMGWMVEEEVHARQLRSFGLIVGGVFTAIGLWPAVFRSEGLRSWALGLAVLLIVPAIVFPSRLKPFYRVWMALGHILGWINTRIILGVIFYGIFTPVGVIMRFMGKDPMRLRFEPDAQTYRVVCQPRSSSHMLRQF